MQFALKELASIIHLVVPKSCNKLSRSQLEGCVNIKGIYFHCLLTPLSKLVLKGLELSKLVVTIDEESTNTLKLSQPGDNKICFAK